MKRLCLLFLLVALVRPVFSQDIVVLLERKQARTPGYSGSVDSAPTFLVRKAENWKGIPTDLQAYAVKQFIVYRTQSRTPVQNQIVILTGTTTAGRRAVIVDANANQDFSDDLRTEFNPGFTTKAQIDSVLAQAPIIEARYDAFDGERIQPRTIAFKTNIYEQDDSDSLEGKWPLTLHSVYNRVGQFTAEQETYQVRLNTDFDDGSFRGQKSSIQLMNARYGLGSGIRYQPGDTLLLGHEEYLFASIEPDFSSLRLKHLRHIENPVGFAEAQYAFPIEQLTLDGKPFSLEALRGRYVLLDFWGTWCAPCVKMIPELKAVHERFKTKNLTLVSVARDRNPELVQKMTQEKGMNWTHLFVDQKDQSRNAVNQFRITCFPTTILIDPKGKIVVRGCGEKDFQRAVAILEQNR